MAWIPARISQFIAVNLCELGEMCSRRSVRLIMSSTLIPRTSSASPISERWQRQGTASAHMMTVGFSRPVQSGAQFPAEIPRCRHIVGVAAKGLVAPAVLTESFVAGASRQAPSVDVIGCLRAGRSNSERFGVVLRHPVATSERCERRLSCSYAMSRSASRRSHRIGCVECPIVKTVRSGDFVAGAMSTLCSLIHGPRVEPEGCVRGKKSLHLFRDEQLHTDWTAPLKLTDSSVPG